MKRLKRLYLILIIFIISSLTCGAIEPVQLYYIGHATVLIEGAGVKILTDPFFDDHIFWIKKRRIPPAIDVVDLPQVDIVLVSHIHPDHCDVKAIKKLSGKPIIIVPWGRGKKLRKEGFYVVELKPGEIVQQEGVTITAVPAKHLWGHCLGYIIDIHGTKIYFTGDTKLFKGFDRLKEYGIDVMLLPYGGTPVFGSIWTTKKAAQAVFQIRPQICIPIHWGTFKKWWTPKEPASPEKFRSIVNKYAPDIRCIILEVGEKCELTEQ